MKCIGLALLVSALIWFSCEKEPVLEMKSVRIPPGVAAKLTADLPHPFIEQKEHLTDLYWATWNLMEKNIRQGNSKNGFADAYLNHRNDGRINQLETCFSALFAIYGNRVFPAMASLDNFYNHQRADGWIGREYAETSGAAVEQPAPDRPGIHPPLFALVEWKYFLLHGDRSRFSRVLPVLDAYFKWIEQNCRGRAQASFLFTGTPWSSGMTAMPREVSYGDGWVDLSAQMALFAKYMTFISRETGADSLTRAYDQRYRFLIRAINGRMWSEEDGFYYDVSETGVRSTTKTAAAFWTLLPEVASLPQARRLAEHLQNPQEFYRTHLFPSVSATHPDFDAATAWRGAVAPCLNYMIIKGLDIYPLRELAAVAALNHLEQMAKVFGEITLSDAGTLWEFYSSDGDEPGRTAAGEMCRSHFTGWSGLGPVALLLENVIGLQPSAPRDELYWNLRLREAHGVENYRFGDNRVDILCERNNLPVEAAEIALRSDSPFNLIVSTQVGMRTFEVNSGVNRFRIEL